MDRAEQGSSQVLLLQRQPFPLSLPAMTVYSPTTTVTTSWFCSTATTTPVGPCDADPGRSSFQIYLAVFLVLGLFVLGGLLFLMVVSVCRAVGERCGGRFGHKVQAFSAPLDNRIVKFANALARWTEDGGRGEKGLVFPARDIEREWDVDI